jgi:hypothetical protein
MSKHPHLRASVIVWAAMALTGNAHSQSSAPSQSAIQNQSRVEAALLPHGRCPANYRLEFVASNWIRCAATSPTAQAPKLPPFAAPVCNGGYALQDAAASKAPERNLYRCVKT